MKKIDPYDDWLRNEGVPIIDSFVEVYLTTGQRIAGIIAEARESGNVGIYRDSGEVRQGLVDEILTQIPEETIIWEAPQKAQQVWFIKLIGTNINLGNIAPADVIPLETLRLGLRSDTFDHFLDLKQV